MGFGGGPGDVARQLRRGGRGRPVGEKLRRIVARLNLERGKVDRRPVEAGRGPSFQSGEGEAGGLKALGERDRRTIAVPSRGRAGLAEMNDAAQECASRHDHRAA